MLLCRNRACNACLRERRPASVSMENRRLGPFLATKLDGELDLGLTASVASRSMSVQLHLNAASTPASYGRIDKWDPREDSRRLAGEPGSGGWGHAQNMRAGGEGGIRTPDRLAPMPHFECGAFNHSATSPEGAIEGLRPLWLGALIGEDGWPDKARKGRIRSLFQPLSRAHRSDELERSPGFLL